MSAASDGTASVPLSRDAEPCGTGAERRVEIGAPPLLVVGCAFLLPIVFAPQVFGWFFTPKAAFALVALGRGLVVALRVAIARDVAATFAPAFLGVVALATALLDAPVMSLLGS
ncbi:MAG: hypothetical protein FJW88_06915 [Actinobacteria bacterium]|nr:hypothetical protein [Actinomycetota bacterium]